jgi:hypothetical protein
MKSLKGPSNPTVLLWWVAVISLAISGALFFFLKEQAQYDVALEQQRRMIAFVGIIIAGICVIVGTAGRWFYPK